MWSPTQVPVSLIRMKHNVFGPVGVNESHIVYGSTWHTHEFGNHPLPAMTVVCIVYYEPINIG